MHVDEVIMIEMYKIIEKLAINFMGVNTCRSWVNNRDYDSVRRVNPGFWKVIIGDTEELRWRDISSQNEIELTFILLRRRLAKNSLHARAVDNVALCISICKFYPIHRPE